MAEVRADNVPLRKQKLLIERFYRESFFPIAYHSVNTL